MTCKQVWGIACLLLCGLSLPAADDAPKMKAELAWAKETATDFLNAGLWRHYQSAEALATGTYRKTLEETGPSSVTHLLSLAFGEGGAESWSIAQEEIAPDKDEALFRGTFRGKKGEAKFVLRVVKETDSGKWRVGFFSAGRYEERPAQVEKLRPVVSDSSPDQALHLTRPACRFLSLHRLPRGPGR
jgi:hypothetical protein